ncbi:MAG TPA: hypothetical protein VN622_09650 [Clostridia bacterium]|nr:hypothetical protein [Clostridia bacterium]
MNAVSFISAAPQGTFKEPPASTYGVSVPVFPADVLFVIAVVALVYFALIFVWHCPSPRHTLMLDLIGVKELTRVEPIAPPTEIEPRRRARA